MSAFVVNDNHISQMLKDAISGIREPYLRLHHGDESITVDSTNVERFGDVLQLENRISVAYRYNEAPDVCDWVSPGLSALGGPQTLELGARLAAIDCYEYQSCEHGTWETSLAYAFCQALRRKLCRRVEGYEGSWETEA